MYKTEITLWTKTAPLTKIAQQTKIPWTKIAPGSDIAKKMRIVSKIIISFQNSNLPASSKKFY